jgi:hypothetical protein
MIFEKVNDYFGGVVYTQAERLNGKKSSPKALYTHLLGTSAIEKLLA